MWIDKKQVVFLHLPNEESYDNHTICGCMMFKCDAIVIATSLNQQDYAQHVKAKGKMIAIALNFPLLYVQICGTSDSNAGY